MAVVKELDQSLINRANSNSMGGTRGNGSNAGYKKLADKILSWPISEAKKQNLLDKLYQKSITGELKEIRKEIFFEDDNFTAYTEGDRAYIKFVMRPKRQLHVALKSRGWWWNSYQSAYSTYLDRVDKEWIATISTRYEQYI